MEILFVVDETDSMGPWLPKVAETIEKIVRSVRTAGAGGGGLEVRLAVAYYGDTFGGTQPATPAELQDVAQAGDGLFENVAKHPLQNGGDALERVFLGLGRGIDDAGFSDVSRKMVILIGDMGNKDLPSLKRCPRRTTPTRSNQTRRERCSGRRRDPGGRERPEHRGPHPQDGPARDGQDSDRILRHPGRQSGQIHRGRHLPGTDERHCGAGRSRDRRALPGRRVRRPAQRLHHRGRRGGRRSARPEDPRPVRGVASARIQIGDELDALRLNFSSRISKETEKILGSQGVLVEDLRKILRRSSRSATPGATMPMAKPRPPPTC